MPRQARKPGTIPVQQDQAQGRGRRHARSEKTTTEENGKECGALISCRMETIKAPT